MPLKDPTKFSDPFPWVWVPGWFLTIVAIFGNTMVIYVIKTSRRLRTQVNVFIVSLAIADLCFGLTYFPSFFTCEFYLPCDRQFRQIFAAYFAYTSFTNLCVMTADRYVAIVMPFRYVYIMTSRRVVTMVIFSWLFPMAFYFLIAIILKQVVSEDIIITFKILRVFIFQLTPCLSLLFATLQMFYIAHKHYRKMTTLVAQLQFNHPSSYRKRKDGFEICSARFVGVVVFFTILYYSVDSYLDLRSYFSTFKNTVDTEYILCLHFITSSAVNPLAYALLKHDINKEVKRLLRVKYRKTERVEETNIVLKSYFRVLGEHLVRN